MDKKSFRMTALLMMFAYFTSYMTRMDFSTVIVQIVEDTHFLKSELSIALVCCSVTYAIGQLVSGFLADRVSPKRLVAVGILTAAGMNVIFPFCPNPVFMAVVWGINGFAQAFIWPPLVKIMLQLMNAEQYATTSVMVTCGSSISTYGVAWISENYSWKLTILTWTLISLIGFVLCLAIMKKWQKTFRIKE